MSQLEGTQNRITVALRDISKFESIVAQLEKHVEGALARRKWRLPNQRVESVTEPV